MFKNIRLLFVVSLFIFTTLAIGCSSGGGTNSTDNSNGSSNTRVGGNLSKTAYDSSNPLIAADSDGNVYIVWDETVPDPDHKELYIAKSGNSGSAFTSAKSLTDVRGSNCPNTIMDITSTDANIVLRSNMPLYLAWTYSWHPSWPGTAIKFFREDDEFCSSVSDISRDADSPYIGISGGENVHTV